MKLFTLVLALMLLLGCAASGDEQHAELENFQACEEPRAQVCTMQYDPVCGLLAGNERKEFSNACGACSDERVAGYQPGPCP